MSKILAFILICSSSMIISMESNLSLDKNQLQGRLFSLIEDEDANDEDNALAVKEVLERGASVCTRDRNGHTPLMRAAELGRTKICVVLIHEGADVNEINDPWKNNPSFLNQVWQGFWTGRLLKELYNASITGTARIKEAYEECEYFGKAPPSFTSPAWPELYGRGSEISRAIHQYQCSTALYYAIFWGNLETCKLLLEKGAKTHPDQYAGDVVTATPAITPLILATELGSYQITQLLLEYGAKPNTQVQSYTYPSYAFPLSIAIEARRLDLCQLLIKHNANINLREKVNNNTRNIFVYDAALKGDFEICKLLLENGAPAESDALEAAARNGHRDVFFLLLESGAQINDCVLTAAVSQELEFFNKVCDAMPNATADDLQTAARQGHPGIWKLLLENHISDIRDLQDVSLRVTGSRIKAAALNGRALVAAAERNDVRMCERLLNSGANIMGPEPSHQIQYQSIPLAEAATCTTHGRTILRKSADELLNLFISHKGAENMFKYPEVLLRLLKLSLKRRNGGMEIIADHLFTPLMQHALFIPIEYLINTSRSYSKADLAILKRLDWFDVAQKKLQHYLFKTALLCLKRCAPKLSNDLLFKIFLIDKSLRFEAFKILLPKLKKILFKPGICNPEDLFPVQFIPSVSYFLYQYTVHKLSIDLGVNSNDIIVNFGHNMLTNITNQIMLARTMLSWFEENKHKEQITFSSATKCPVIF